MQNRRYKFHNQRSLHTTTGLCLAPITTTQTESVMFSYISMEGPVSHKVKRKMPLKCPFCWRCFRYNLSREMHIKDDHTDLYQSYKRSDEANDTNSVDDFLKHEQNAQTQQAWAGSAVNWAQLAHRHIKLKKRIDDFKLVRPAKSFIKNNARKIQQSQRQPRAPPAPRMIQVVNDQEHSPSSTGTTSSDSNNSNEKQQHAKDDCEDMNEHDNEDDNESTIDVETVPELNHAPVRVSVIVKNPNRIV